jgi:alpha-1,3/alpha-1,6-mannosyltransferase
MATTEHNSRTAATPRPPPPTDSQLLAKQRISFLHLDLGIGGAEQLVLQLAQASVATGAAEVELWTTRCDADHCFAAVAPGGVLHNFLRVRGRWIPTEIMGKGRALCSTMRLWYLTLCWIGQRGRDPHQVVVLDVLPTPLPLLQACTAAHLLFYCHFPDQLLTRPGGGGTTSRARQLYRHVLNALENACMPFADTIAVNSKFTQSVVRDTFASLQSRELPVLYPALDTSSLDAASALDTIAIDQHDPHHRDDAPIVSLNRYERKKNLRLLLEAARWIQQEHGTTIKLPRIIMAGGYDVRNVENVEHRAELGRLVQDYGLTEVVTFRQSISDHERQHLLKTALCVVYTPSHEHFGIVPLEAMYCRTPVLAVNSGGPLESILDNVTGFLREPTAEDFGRALLAWIRDPARARTMGEAGRRHVASQFGFAPRMVEEWTTVLQETVRKGERRQRDAFYRYRVGHGVVYILEVVLILLVCLFATHLLRWIQLLEAEESLLSGIKRGFRSRDEL